jgi:hypothetical protein
MGIDVSALNEVEINLTHCKEPVIRCQYLATKSGVTDQYQRHSPGLALQVGQRESQRRSEGTERQRSPAATLVQPDPILRSQMRQAGPTCDSVVPQGNSHLRVNE